MFLFSKGKPHTALVKFRESFASNSGHVEALFNIGKSYHELAYFDREISIWKYILEVRNLLYANIFGVQG